MKRFLATFGCLVVLAAAAFNSGSAQPTDTVKPLMRAKLAQAQSILEGLALEDFDKIAKGSNELAVTSQAAGWQVFQTPEYAAKSADFRRTCDELTKHAKAKNLEAATLDYVKLTTQCVECHKYVRGVRVTSAAPSGRLALVH